MSRPRASSTSRHPAQVRRASNLSLWVPEILRTSCGLLILVDQSTEPVASLNAVRLGG